MAVKAKIVSVDEKAHQVTLRYFTDALSEDALATSFKLEKYQPDPDADENHWLERWVIARFPDDSPLAGSPLQCQTDRAVDVLVVPAPEGQALLDYVTKACPPQREWLAVMEMVADPAVDTAMPGAIKAMGEVFEIPEPVEVPAPAIQAAATAVELRARRTPDRQVQTIVL